MKPIYSILSFFLMMTHKYEFLFTVQRNGEDDEGFPFGEDIPRHIRSEIINLMRSIGVKVNMNDQFYQRHRESPFIIGIQCSIKDGTDIGNIQSSELVFFFAAHPVEIVPRVYPQRQKVDRKTLKGRNSNKWSS